MEFQQPISKFERTSQLMIRTRTSHFFRPGVKNKKPVSQNLAMS